MNVQADAVKQTIADNKVVVYSKTYCPYCTKVREIREKYIDSRQQQNRGTNSSNSRFINYCSTSCGIAAAQCNPDDHLQLLSDSLQA